MATIAETSGKIVEQSSNKLVQESQNWRTTLGQSAAMVAAAGMGCSIFAILYTDSGIKRRDITIS